MKKARKVPIPAGSKNRRNSKIPALFDSAGITALCATDYAAQYTTIGGVVATLKEHYQTDSKNESKPYIMVPVLHRCERLMQLAVFFSLLWKYFELLGCYKKFQKLYQKNLLEIKEFVGDEEFKIDLKYYQKHYEELVTDYLQHNGFALELSVILGAEEQDGDFADYISVDNWVVVMRIIKLNSILKFYFLYHRLLGEDGPLLLKKSVRDYTKCLQYLFIEL
ncbi:MAG: hypothetical protein PHD97_08655 [Bacteroidales bacterium]|nr:hypothetical protein [Bacteroidales bacterium]